MPSNQDGYLKKNIVLNNSVLVNKYVTGSIDNSMKIEVRWDSNGLSEQRTNIENRIIF